MRFTEYSHRHGKEIMHLTHKKELDEILSTLTNLPRFPHGQSKNRTVKEYIASEFAKQGWDKEAEIPHLNLSPVSASLRYNHFIYLLTSYP